MQGCKKHHEDISECSSLPEEFQFQGINSNIDFSLADRIMDYIASHNNPKLTRGTFPSFNGDYASVASLYKIVLTSYTYL